MAPATARPGTSHPPAPGRASVGPVARGLVRACHPGPTAVVTALATALAAGLGAPVTTVLAVAGAVLAGQLSIGWSNDWLDAERDALVERVGKPVVQGLVSAAGLRLAAGLALAVCTVLSLATGVVPGVVHVLAVLSGWSYNVALKRTALSWLPYAVSFGLLPAFVVLALPGRPAPAAWALVAGALLGTGAHVANVLPDLEDDHRTGVHGLPHRLGRRGSSVVAPVVLVSAVAVVLLGAADGGGPSPWAVAVGVGAGALAAGAGVVGVVRPSSRLPFRLSMAVAALCVGLLVASADRLTPR
ncbi:UbiA family prenyltransferase [Actinotalea subterranea]|uniref:UbiA family prenyltransferase n=1 Tax=Actinotalea subterranea TaxID=2607497 RepID=UPI0011EF5892|nr:UbiA family prenyltransferase [Actinotalea subterranea]